MSLLCVIEMGSLLLVARLPCDVTTCFAGSGKRAFRAMLPRISEAGYHQRPPPRVWRIALAIDLSKG